MIRDMYEKCLNSGWDKVGEETGTSISPPKAETLVEAEGQVLRDSHPG